MLEFDELRSLQLAEGIADDVWDVVMSWNAFARDVFGKQLIRASDSIGANIAEAFGRFHYGEKINFLYYARGSVFESKYWLNRALKRRLVSGQQHEQYAERLTEMAKIVNGYASKLKKYRSTKNIEEVSSLRESGPAYTVGNDEEQETLFSATHLAWLRSGLDSSEEILHRIRNTTTI